jgi:hypothetical protein
LLALADRLASMSRKLSRQVSCAQHWEVRRLDR